jgi:hypothetical protein
MVRYPFDLLRAVNKVERLTTYGKSNTYGLYDPFALMFTRLGRVRPPKAAPDATRVSKGERSSCKTESDRLGLGHLVLLWKLEMKQ